MNNDINITHKSDWFPTIAWSTIMSVLIQQPMTGDGGFQEMKYSAIHLFTFSPSLHLHLPNNTALFQSQRSRRYRYALLPFSSGGGV